MPDTWDAEWETPTGSTPAIATDEMTKAGEN